MTNGVMMQTLQQQLISRPLHDIPLVVKKQIGTLRGKLGLPAGASVAVGCSRRGISNYAAIVGAVVAGLRDLGLEPFCFPAMGSHGSTTAGGQVQVLARAGITEETMGVRSGRPSRSKCSVSCPAVCLWRWTSTPTTPTRSWS